MASLPPEIWRQVASYIAPELLQHLYSLNKAFFDAAMDVRYREVRLDSECLGEGEGERVLDRLGSPTVSSRVRRLYLSSHDQVEDGQSPHENESQRSKSLIKSLARRAFGSRQHQVTRVASNDTTTQLREKLERAIPLLTNVRAFHLSWTSSKDHASPYLDIAWKTFALTLTELHLTITTTKALALFPLPLPFPSLQILHIHILGRTSIAPCQAVLAAFVNTLHATLQSLSIRSTPVRNLSDFYLGLGHFNYLSALDVDISTDATFKSSVVPGYTAFIDQQRQVTEELTLYIPPDQSTTWRLEEPRLSKLEKLTIAAGLVDNNWDQCTRFMKRHMKKLASFSTDGRIYPARLASFLEVFHHRNPYSVLCTLSFSAASLDVRLMDLLANGLFRLRSLTLLIDSVAVHAKCTVIPSEFYPRGSPADPPLPFIRGLRACDALKKWELEDITIKRHSCCGELILWGLMEVCAGVVPSIKSFVGVESLSVPVPSNVPPKRCVGRGFGASEAEALLGLSFKFSSCMLRHKKRRELAATREEHWQARQELWKNDMSYLNSRTDIASEKSGQAPIPVSREIDSMQSHRKSISKDPNSQDSQTYTQLAHAIVRFLGLESQEELAEYNLNNAGELVDLISRFTTNTFTVSTPALAPLGACVSPLVALINHSCDPNAVVVFPRATSRREDEPLMQVIALKHIAPDEEVLTAYIDTTLPREHRKKILNETYHFTCRCPLCAPPPPAANSSALDMREAMWCPKKCGGMCPLPTEEKSLTRCNRCKTPVKDTDAVLDAVRVGQEALHKAEALQFTNPTKSIQLTTKLVPILVSVGLVPAAYPLLALCRLCASLLISHLSPATSDVEEVLSPELQSSSSSSSSSLPADPMNKRTDPRTPEEQQEALDDAIRAATRASSGLSLILAEGLPVRGVALAELGKLLAVHEPCPAGVEPGSQGVSSPGAPAISPSPPSPLPLPSPSPSPSPLTMHPHPHLNSTPTPKTHTHTHTLPTLRPTLRPTPPQTRLRNARARAG
uniref:SET domain-containing protein n=1 Tax=Psilocybe cubensis TaxID=181762 RepID=A0A8H8CFP6_PSICU